MSAQNRVDVVVVGYGPVGQVLTALLGRRGHRVLVLEQHTSRYGLPRAAHLDGEALRILQQVGAADDVAAASWAQTSYEFLTRDRELIHRIDFRHLDPSGWSAGYFCHGPIMESIVDRCVQAIDSTSVRMGAEVADIRPGAGSQDGLEVVLADGETIATSWVVGADGANSVVRRLAGIEVQDLGYGAEWLVVDVRPDDPELAIDMPEAAQICDPERPVSVFRRLGRDHLRVEFPVLPGDDWTTDAVWAALAEWGLCEDNSSLVRNTVYTFGSQLAGTYRRDRVLLAGDAAHLMPPFLGQGLCSGLRDAAALAWRLDRVLAGRSDPALLDSYGDERRPHVEALIEASAGIGRIIGADLPPANIGAALAALPTEPAPLSHGLLDPRRRAGTGTAAPQSVVSVHGVKTRTDDLTAGRWMLLLRDTTTSLTDGFVELDVAVHTLAGNAPERIDDIDGTFTRWLAALDAAAVLIRPDHYVHTVVRDTAELPEVLGTLREHLAVREYLAVREQLAVREHLATSGPRR